MCVYTARIFDRHLRRAKHDRIGNYVYVYATGAELLISIVTVGRSPRYGDGA